MEKRYNTPELLSKGQYSPGAPVMLLSGARVRNSQTGETCLRLKFRSLEEGILVGILLELRTAQGESLERLITGFTLREGETVSRLVPVPENAQGTIFLREVYYSNREDWHNPHDLPLTPIPRQRTLEEVLGDPLLVTQFQRETKPTAAFWPERHEDLWLCACGEVNKQEKTHCVRCAMGWEELQRLSSPEVLEKRSRRYRKNRRIWNRKHRLRRKWSVAALAVLVVVSVVLMYAGRLENRRTEETLAPYCAGAYADFQNMVLSSAGADAGILFSAEYTDMQIQEGQFTIHATFTAQVGEIYSHMPVTITGTLGENTQEMTPGVPYVTDKDGNRLG